MKITNTNNDTDTITCDSFDLLCARAEAWIEYPVLLHFLSQEVGHVASEHDHTLVADEIAIIGKRVLKAAAYDAVKRDSYADNLHRTMAFATAELTEQERISMVNGLYKTAAKKVLWLNTISKARTGQAFVRKLININDKQEVKRLALAFVFIMTNQDVF